MTQNFDLSTANLDVAVKDGSTNSPKNPVVNISKSSTINAIGGDIKMGSWSSRETRIESRSGSIRGNFALRDILSVTSASGSIDIGVEPQAADADRPVPADFTAYSASGGVDVAFPANGDIPEREYKTLVTTSSGQSSTQRHQQHKASRAGGH